MRKRPEFEEEEKKKKKKKTVTAWFEFTPGVRVTAEDANNYAINPI